jgi:two-component system chemotaxis response regulator CheB
MSLTPPVRTRVLIVDDSAVMRTVIKRCLASESDIEVVGQATNGEQAVKSAASLKPDIILLDIEMPIMDGITALPLILKEIPGVKVLICSTLSARGADISIKALALGATDCILKPGGEAANSAIDFQNDLIRMVRSLAPRHKVTTSFATTPKPLITLIKPNGAILPPKIIAIGSSTGGPKALMDVLTHLKNLPVPIVITQHMPKTFTALLAQHITQATKIPCFEGKEGEPIKAGHAYIAPGGFHMILSKNGDAVCTHMTETPPENFCRPSVNPMLRSLFPIYGNRILSVILTGMGNDGSQACAELVALGGQVIAQNEASSVVWGMPGAVANAGICSAVLPIGEIAPWVMRAMKGGFA